MSGAAAPTGDAAADVRGLARRCATRYARVITHEVRRVEAFLFGYWGWGSNTELLLDVTAQVEDKRGFAPPCFVDIRVSRSVRAAGFREQAFEKLAGPDRYLWMPELGNKRITERATGIEIVEPRAAERLLDLIVHRREKNQRVIFFCACELPGTSDAPQCHRRVVADLLVGAARSRGVSLVAGEWPGGEPVEVTVDLSPRDYKKLLGRAATLKTALPTADAAGLPWGTIVTARCDGESYSFVSGPARVSRGELVLPLCAWGHEDLREGWRAYDRGAGVGWPSAAG